MYYFEKLLVWQESVVLIKLIYKFSNKLPKEEKFGLIDQIKRAVTSISLNIAEGSGSGSKKSFSAYLDNAKRSLYEVVAILKICNNLFSVNIGYELSQCDNVIKLLQGLIKKLKS
ncbi:MAG: four helix bundle protein [Patescibacteria group bacterium]